MDRDKWLQERQRIPGIGASNAAALYGLHPYASAFSLFEKMTNPRPLTDEQQEEMTDEQEYGLAIEEPLAKWYARKTQRQVEKPVDPTGVFRLKERPHIFCSPDRFIWKDDQIVGVLQLKSGIHFNPSEPLPDHWEVQEQHEMLVTGMAFASFAIWGTFRKRYFCNDLPANPAFQSIHIEQCERFLYAVRCGRWDKWGEGIDGSHATSEALKRLYKRESGGTIKLGDEACLWAENLAFAKAEKIAVEKNEVLFSNKLRAAIGENTYAELPDGRRFSLKTQTNPEHIVKESTFRVLRQTDEER